MGGLTQNSVSPVPKKDWALVFLGFDWGLLGTWGLGLGLGLDNFLVWLLFIWEHPAEQRSVRLNSTKMKFSEIWQTSLIVAGHISERKRMKISCE